MENDLIIRANSNRVSSAKALGGVISFCDITFVFSGQLRYIIDGEEILAGNCRPLRISQL